MSASGDNEVRLYLLPLGMTVRGRRDENILSVLVREKVSLAGACGGRGSCGKCRLLILEGSTGPPTTAEKELLSGEDLRRGTRLACQALAKGDLKIYIPASSLIREQRLLVEGVWEAPPFEPPVKVVRARGAASSTGGPPRSDLSLITASGGEAVGAEAMRTDLEGLKEVSLGLRSGGSEVHAVFRDGELLGTVRPGAGALGVAVDLGTTKVALFAHELSSGEAVSSCGIPNPQAPYGEDVITRLQHVLEDRERGNDLARLVREGMNEALSGMLAAAGYSTRDVFEVVLVGNTAMHHLFLGLPVEGLARSPYMPVTHLPLEVKARDLGLSLHPAAMVYLPPPVAGYVGSDHLAAICATRLKEREGPCLLLDIGTNTEVSLQVEGRIRCCSCASGPAFEGMGISQGMRAAEGAVEGVEVDAAGRLEVRVIGEAPPAGICGSGILSALAALLKSGAMEDSGRLRPGHPGVSEKDGEAACWLVPPGKGGRGGVAVTQSDIREIQKAKGAVRAGVEALLAEAGIPHTEVKEVLLAGAFGSYLDPMDILSIAMLPPFPLEIIRQVGNAAGAGARFMLLSGDFRRRAEELAGDLDYLELSAYPPLARLFAASMYLTEEAVARAMSRFKV
ncbi:ASKHA domain-containing protein [Candidatus Solincola tengchongensis]|uniref:ASKHA domain-containing protein n=1 Tax=Candidatus Solincola tengchongensis TaxID=2900693 RepID=UPI00257A5BA6|nr:ASKHA domain-containing protein [Candidatus Solincola tengchongensis]